MARTLKAKKPLGWIVYDGPSLLDGTPIVALYRPSSNNRKTGAMDQLFILARDISPVDAVLTGADASVCGNCPLRGIIVRTPEPPKRRASRQVPHGLWSANYKRACYVVVCQSPQSAWKAYRRGRYVPATADQVRDIRGTAPVRLGAYGDPAAVPAHIIVGLTRGARKWTGYTHQWSTCDQTLRQVLMASTDATDYARAVSLGWRCFSVVSSAAAAPGSILCPASEEAGKRATCETCGLCNGARPRVRNVYIPAHGNGKTHIITLTAAA